MPYPSLSSTPILLRCLSFPLCLLAAPFANAGGGCGSQHLPTLRTTLDGTSSSTSPFTLSLVTEFSDRDDYREGDDTVTNPGQARAIIQFTNVVLDYRPSKRWTLSLYLPYVRKVQNTRRFGEREATGLGDASVFGRYQFNDLFGISHSSLAVGLGVKFPTGDTDDPGPTNRLPPAFQTGSDALDVLPTINFSKNYGRVTFFTGAYYRLPTESNDEGYRFGEEYNYNFGVSFTAGKRVSLFSHLNRVEVNRDEDPNGLAPGRVREGDVVLNTGGDFTNLTLGVDVNATKTLSFNLSVEYPLDEDWNGRRSTNVGQVAADYTVEAGVSFDF